jgi:hypothetical protein
MLPTVQLQDTHPSSTSTHKETLLDAAKRALRLVAGSDIQVRFLSPCPLAVHMLPYTNQDTYFGEKTFYIKGSYERGTASLDLLNTKHEDWAWLTRHEMVHRVSQDQDKQTSLFYHYLL